jgi:hypothetical protein
MLEAVENVIIGKKYASEQMRTINRLEQSRLSGVLETDDSMHVNIKIENKINDIINTIMKEKFLILLF